MTEHKYQLEKYDGQKSRYVCPECKMRGQFTRYKDQETNEYLHQTVGKCNREDKCAYHYTPAQYFKDNGESYNPIIKVTPRPIKPIEFISDEVMTNSLNTDNNFIKFLTSLFDIKDVTKAIELYNLGDTEEGKVIFWQVDREKRVRTGKAMQYDPITGKRTKEVNWMHEKGFNFKQCLYGLHLIDKNKPIAVVESEKTAVIASIVIPNYTWMSTGGKQNTKLIDELKAMAYEFQEGNLVVSLKVKDKEVAVHELRVKSQEGQIILLKRPHRSVIF